MSTLRELCLKTVINGQAIFCNEKRLQNLRKILGALQRGEIYFYYFDSVHIAEWNDEEGSRQFFPFPKKTWPGGAMLLLSQLDAQRTHHNSSDNSWHLTAEKIFCTADTDWKGKATTVITWGAHEVQHRDDDGGHQHQVSSTEISAHQNATKIGPGHSPGRLIFPSASQTHESERRADWVSVLWWLGSAAVWNAWHQSCVWAVFNLILFVSLIAYANFSVLEVGLSSTVSNAGFEALSKLCHLRHFLFGNTIDNDSEWEQEQKFLLLCSQYLPHLKVAGRSLDNLQWYTSTEETFFYEDCQKYHNIIVQIKQSAKLSLEHLFIGGEVQLNENFECPELQRLILWKPSADIFSLCERFTSISVLELCCIDSSPLQRESILRVLQSMGLRLRSLKLSYSSNLLSLAQVLQYCPSLKNFLAYFSHFKDALMEWPDSIFSCMEIFSLCFVSKLPPGSITQVNAYFTVYNIN